MYIYHCKATSRMGTVSTTLHGLPTLFCMKDVCTLTNEIRVKHSRLLVSARADDTFQRCLCL